MPINKIILLLSNHRQSSNQEMPLALNKHQIVSLIGASISPNESQELLVTQIEAALDELQAQGEILAGSRNRYCMAPPTVLAVDNEDLAGLRFRGDRAYLTLAHQALNSPLERQQNPLLLYPQIQRLHWIKDRLSQVRLRFLTAADSIENLPQPRKPLKQQLRSPWLQNPFTIKNWHNKRYIPSDTIQKNRWQSLSQNDLKNHDLLQIPTGEYLWYQEQNFYELEPDIAILAMFQLDIEQQLPLKICWDQVQGRLNLQGVILPSNYARWLWHLSEPDLEIYRNRYFPPANRLLVEAAIKRLGSILV